MNNKALAIKEIKKRLGNKTKILETFDSEFKAGCNMCGKCCRDREDILLTVADIRNLCIGLNINLPELVTKYLEIYIGDNSKLPLSIINFKSKLYGSSGTVCPFLKNNNGKYLCKVNDFKPNLCRLFPVAKINYIDSDKFESFYSVGDIDCLPDEEQSMFKLRDWIGTEEKQDINSKWVEAYSEKVNRFKKIVKGREEKIYKVQGAILLLFSYFHKTNLEVDDQTAIKEYLDPQNKSNCEVERLIKNILN